MSQRSSSTSLLPIPTLVRKSWSLLLIGVLFFSLAACDTGQNQAPTSDFSFEPERPRAGHDTVTFTSEATDPEGSIQEYVWVIFRPQQDSRVDTVRGESFKTDFPITGSYDVEHTVRDRISLFDTETKTVNVRLRYSQSTLTELEVARIPYNTQDGQDWTNDDDPNVYFTISGPSGQLFESDRKSGFTPSDLPISFDISDFDFTDLQTSYTLSFYDEDEASSDSDDLIIEKEFDFSDNIACNINATICYPNPEPKRVMKPEDIEPASTDLLTYLYLNWSN